MEGVRNTLSSQARGDFGFDVAMVSVGMVASIVGALVLAAGMAAHDLIKAAAVPIIKLKSTSRMPELTLALGQNGISSCETLPNTYVTAES